MQSNRRFLLPSAALTVAGVVLSRTLTSDLGIGRVTAVGCTAIVLGFAARVIALRMSGPAMVLAVPASVGMLPGLAIFVGLYRLMVKSGSDLSNELTVQVGVQTMATALGVLVAIATGTVLGDILAAPLDHQVWRRRRRVARSEAE